MLPFKKIRFFLRLSSAFFKKRLGIIFLGIGLGVIFYLFFPKISKFFPKIRQTEKIGILGKYTTSEIPPNILHKISYGLTEITPEGEIIPKICDRWEVSNDGKIYTFYFSTKKFDWHDGTKFTPDDVNYNFKDAKIMPIDFQTLKIILKEPFSPFLSVVSRPIFKKGLIGLGPYKVKKIERSGQILKSIFLTPTDKKSSLPSLYYKFYINESYLKLAFKLGEINKIEEVNEKEDLVGWGNISIIPFSPSNRQVILFFNTSKDPFSAKSFRQAIAYAIEKENDKNRALGPISNASWAFNPGVKKYEKDLQKAKLLLSKVKISQESTFSLITFPSLEKEARRIKDEIESLGIKVEIKISSFVPEDFDLLLAVQEIPVDPDQYSYWHSGQRLNISRFSNPRIDKLLEDGRKTLDSEERRRIYFDFQRFLVEESPVVFLYYPTYYSVERR